MLLPSRILRDVSATGCAHVMLIHDEPLPCLLSQHPLSGHFPVPRAVCRLMEVQL